MRRRVEAVSILADVDDGVVATVICNDSEILCSLCERASRSREVCKRPGREICCTFLKSRSQNIKIAARQRHRGHGSLLNLCVDNLSVKLLLNMNHIKLDLTGTDKLNVRYIGVFLSLKDCIDLFESLTFRFDPVHSLFSVSNSVCYCGAS